MNEYLRSAIKALLLVAVLTGLHFFIRRDYQAIAFGVVILLIIYAEFFYPKNKSRK